MLTAEKFFSAFEYLRIDLTNGVLVALKLRQELGDLNYCPVYLWLYHIAEPVHKYVERQNHTEYEACRQYKS